ncbi:hypothetical protein [Nitrospira sp. Kam-Ns4a]
MARPVTQPKAVRPRRLPPAGAWPAAAMLAAIAQLAGCATKGDLEALKQELQQASASQIEAVKGQAKSGFEATKKQLEEQDRKIAQDLKALQDSLNKLAEQIRANQARLADSQTRYEDLAKQTQALRAAVQAANHAMVEFLRSQEARLKEDLRHVQGAMKQLAGEEKLQDPKELVEKPK